MGGPFLPPRLRSSSLYPKGRNGLRSSHRLSRPFGYRLLPFSTTRPSSTGESWSCTTSAPVPGSTTPREQAVAHGSVRKLRIGPWSSWGSWFGQWSPDQPGLCDRRRRGEKRAQSLLLTTSRPFSTGEKLVLFMLVRAVVS